MTEIETQIENLLTDATDQEQKARRRAFYWTIIPVAMALVLLMGTGLQMRSANQAVLSAKGELDKTELELQSLSLDLDNTLDALEDADMKVVEAQTALTDTMYTLETITNDLVTTREQLFQTEQEVTILERDVSGLEEKITNYNELIDDLNGQIQELEQSLESVRDELQATIDLKRYKFAGDWALTVKNIAVEFPAAGALLQTIVELQEIPWRVGGFAPDQGFDSPSFATFVLDTNERIELNDPADRYNLVELVPVHRSPQVGDIIFYEGGYTMFYFIDEQGVPFVIGMTTQGVLALSPDFATVRGYGGTER